MKRRRIKLLFIITALACVLMVGHFILSYPWYGFGVDSGGRLYLGEKEQIIVLVDREIVRSIEIPPNRSYYFTVQKDDTILFVSTSFIYILDLEGNELSSGPDRGAKRFSELQRLDEVETATGETYYCRNILGCRTIARDDGVVIYQTPFMEVFQKSALVLLSAVFILAGFADVWEKLRKSM